MNDIFHKKENEKEKVYVTTPRKRKGQRTLEKIDQILDNVDASQHSKKKKILKLIYKKEDDHQTLDQSKMENETQKTLEKLIDKKLSYEITDIYLKEENETEKGEVTPRKRKTQRTSAKIDQILGNGNPSQFSKNKNILKSRFQKL